MGTMSPKDQVKLFHESATERRRVFKKLLAHVEDGYSIGSFPDLDPSTVNKYFDVYPEEFVREEFEKALRVSQRGWEIIGRDQATGKCLGNSKSWIYNMINRFNWTDRVVVQNEQKGTLEVSVTHYNKSDICRDELEGAQSE